MAYETFGQKVAKHIAYQDDEIKRLRDELEQEKELLRRANAINAKLSEEIRELKKQP